MGKFASERLCDAFEVLEKHTANAPIANVFGEIWEGHSGASSQIAIGYLFLDVKSEICLSRLTEKAQSRALAKVDGLAAAFQLALNNVNWESFRKEYSCKDACNDLEDISDLLETAGLVRSISLDRDAIFNSTQKLIKDIEGFRLPENVFSVVKLELSSLNRLLAISSGASDEMIARAVKSIVADLLVGLAPYIADEPNLRDSIVQWGKKSTYATAFALGLLVDGSATLGLIIGPKDIPLISAPQKQISDQKQISAPKGEDKK